MFNLNRVQIAGCLTRDPDFRSTSSGTNICEFGMAINRNSKTGNGETTFVDVSSWNKTAEICRQYLHKGSNVYLDGHLTFESWQDKNGGKHSKLKVTADSVQFIGSPRSESTETARSANPTSDHRTYTEADCPPARSTPVAKSGETADELPPF